MSVANPTPPEKLVDDRSRPYFLWDTDMTLDEFEAKLGDSNPEVRAYFVGKLMRQARPDDVFAFVGLRQIDELWSLLERHPLPVVLGTRG